MIATDQLDADVLSAWRSLISGFPSLERARDTTQRFTSDELSADNLEQVSAQTRDRLRLLRSLHRVLTDYEKLGIPRLTMLHDIPLLVRTLKIADQQIRSGIGFQDLD